MKKSNEILYSKGKNDECYTPKNAVIPIIKYIPKDRVLGISKLQRFVNWASRRGWLQEDLTRYIGNTIKRIARTEDVYVRLEDLTHGCERFRGSQSRDGKLTTEFKSGVFENKKSKILND